MMKSAIFGFVLALALVATPAGYANDFFSNVPECLDKSDPIPVDNTQVIDWKTKTRNQFKARAHIKGVVREVYPDRNNHLHFELIIGRNAGDDIEVIFNEDFGRTPPIIAGMEVEACGDYITSVAPSGRYPASPDGAIIHWVHRSTSPQRHPSGFMVVDGTVYGQDISRAGRKRRH